MKVYTVLLDGEIISPYVFQNKADAHAAAIQWLDDNIRSEEWKEQADWSGYDNVEEYRAEMFKYDDYLNDWDITIWEGSLQ